MTDKLCRAAPWFAFGHKFEPRYDLSPAKSLDQILGGEGNFQGNVNGLFEKSRSRKYIHDICVRCGITIKRGTP